MAHTSQASLRRAVKALCLQLQGRVSAATQRHVDEIARRLDAPLQVAIAGRVNAGKSTLVNTLLGLKVARTDEGECTRLVAHFRRGTSDLIVVHRRNGRSTRLPLGADGLLPAHPAAGDAPEDISHLEVALTSTRLDDYEIIDTPGLLSVNTTISAMTEDLLAGHAQPRRLGPAPTDDRIDTDSRQALLEAEVVIYVYAQQVHEEDVNALRSFRDMSARLLSSPVNTIAVLNKIDKLCDDPTDDPWPVAHRIAGKQSMLLGPVAGIVVPLIGRLAESTVTGRLNSADCAALRALARLPEQQREVLLLDSQSFRTLPCEVPPEARARLIALLDLYGIAVAIREIGESGHLADPALLERLHRASGITDLSQIIGRVVARRVDVIKAAAALTHLERVARFAPGPDQSRLNAGVERLRLNPEFFVLHFVSAARRLAGTQRDLPDDLRRAVVRMATADTPAGILGRPEGTLQHQRDDAVAQTGQWRRLATFGTGEHRRIAQDVVDGLMALHDHLGAVTTPMPPEGTR